MHPLWAGGVGYALLSSSLLVLIPVCVVGGLLVGPAISCMMDALFRSYRDAPRGWWENYCKGMKQNWKASLLPGVVFSLALGIELFFGMVLFSGEGMPGIGTMAVFSGRAADPVHAVYCVLAAGGIV